MRLSRLGLLFVGGLNLMDTVLVHTEDASSCHEGS